MNFFEAGSTSPVNAFGRVLLSFFVFSLVFNGLAWIAFSLGLQNFLGKILQIGGFVTVIAISAPLLLAAQTSKSNRKLVVILGFTSIFILYLSAMYFEVNWARLLFPTVPGLPMEFNLVRVGGFAVVTLVLGAICYILVEDAASDSPGSSVAEDVFENAAQELGESIGKRSKDLDFIDLQRD